MQQLTVKRRRKLLSNTNNQLLQCRLPAFPSRFDALLKFAYPLILFFNTFLVFFNLMPPQLVNQKF